jgi:cell division transport system permease protein
MNSVIFFRLLKSGFVNFWRHIWLSAAATLVMVITLVMLSILLVVYGFTNYSLTNLQERVDMSVYFKTTAPASQIEIVSKDVKAYPKVKEVTLISAEDGLKLFKARHQSDPAILQSLDEIGDNPIPATLQIKAVTLADYPDIASFLSADKYQTVINRVNFEDNRKVIERLNKLVKLVVATGIIIASIFIFAAILVIFNTFALTIYNRREEIEIMRLVGATNWYIRGPFLIEAIVYSLLSTIITALLFFPVYVKLVPQIIKFIAPELPVSSALNPGSLILLPPASNFWLLILSQFGFAVILSIVSSLLAMRRHLKI